MSWTGILIICIAVTALVWGLWISMKDSLPKE